MYEPERSHGWTVFAAIAFALAGCWNAILGITALAEPSFFRNPKLPFESLTFWGVAWLTVGVLQGITSMLLLMKRVAGRAIGLILTSLSIVVTILPVGARAEWTLLILGLDGLILYALTAKERPQMGGYRGVAGPSTEVSQMSSFRIT